MEPLEAYSWEQLLVLARDLLKVNSEQQERIALLEKEVARLRGGDPPAPPAVAAGPPRALPAFVKPNRPAKAEPKKPRKKRAHGFARRRETPTRVVEHYPSRCSCCGRKLSGGWEQTSRQVIELPVAPVEVIEHHFMGRQCGVCGHREIARPDMSGVALGKSRLGLGLMSFIAYLDTVCRVPLRTIRSLLEGVYGLRLSEGELVRVLHTVAQSGQPIYDDLLEQLRRSPVVQADETGSREDGRNGYVWSLSNPSVRYYHRDGSRAAAVVQRLLGHEPAVYQARSGREVMQARREARAGTQPRFDGKLVTDFYSGYSWYPGPHQCCLVHLDRDLDDLKAKHPDNPAVCSWVERALDMIERAKTYAREHPDAERAPRRRQRAVFEREAEELARPYLRSALPQRVLAQRLIKHRRQLFVFVEYPDVPADNNAAERAIRPFVVQRKVSGGTRSQAGSKTQVVLLSLFGTWMLRGENALQSCRRMLAKGPAPAPT